MITKPIRFIQIAVNSDHIYGLTPDGEVFYRDKVPYTYTYNSTTQKKDDAEEKKTWKKLFMEYKFEIPRGGDEREAQGATEEPSVETIVDLPARKIYKDVETIKRVQGALQDKNFYKKTNRLDGELAQFTVSAIKEYQKSVNLPETGDIDLALCTSLGLNGVEECEILTNAQTDNVIISGELEESNVTGA